MHGSVNFPPCSETLSAEHRPDWQSFIGKYKVPTQCSKSSRIDFLFVVYVHLENISFIWSRHRYLWMSANFDLCSELRVISRKLLSFSVTHLRYQNICWYGHLRIYMYVTIKPTTNVWHWSCFILFKGSCLLPALNLPHARLTLKSSASTPRITFFVDFTSIFDILTKLIPEAHCASIRQEYLRI